MLSMRVVLGEPCRKNPYDDVSAMIAWCLAFVQLYKEVTGSFEVHARNAIGHADHCGLP
jgi:hypothetical protein